MHIMLDIETLGKRTDACLIQVAAIAFDIETGQRSHTFNGVINNSGGVLDVDTVAWWMQQAHASALGAKLQDPNQAGDECAILRELCSFFRLCGDVEAVWAHGATFDFPILQSALTRHGLPVPWHYRAPRDTRTLFAEAPGGMPKPPKDETRAHDALYDCEYQIAQVVEAARRIRESLAAGEKLTAALAEVERWKEEYRVTEEARASFESALNSMREAKAGWKQRALDLGFAETDAPADSDPDAHTSDIQAGGSFPPSPYPFANQDALNAYAEYQQHPLAAEPPHPIVDQAIIDSGEY